MRRLTTKRGLLFAFDSTADMDDFADPQMWNHATMSHVRNNAGFVGERLGTWEDVQKRMKRDWAEGMYILNQFVEQLKKAPIPELKSHKRKTHFDETEGDEVDYDRLMQGQTFWRRSDREEQTGPTEVTVIIDTTTPAFRNASDILWRGAAAIALTQLLEEKGYSVELWVVNGSELFSDDDRAIMTACCLKRCSDPLDVSTLINTVAGWFYRTVTFTTLLSICKLERRKPAYGYGPCYTPTQDDLDAISRDELRIYSAGVYSFSGALQTIQHELSRFTVKATESK